MLKITPGDHNKYIITYLEDKTSYAHLSFRENGNGKYIKVEINGLDSFDGEFSKTFCVRTTDKKIIDNNRGKKSGAGNIYEDGANHLLEEKALERQITENMSQISLKHIREDLGKPVYDAIIRELDNGVPTRKCRESVVFKSIGSSIDKAYKDKQIE